MALVLAYCKPTPRPSLPEIPAGDWSSCVMESITNLFNCGSIATFMHWSFDLHRFLYALHSAFCAVYIPRTLFPLISSDTLETLRSNLPAINRRLFLPRTYLSIR